MSRAKQIKEQRREREKDREFKEQQQALQQAFNAQGELDRTWMEQIIDTDDLEEHLQPHTIDKIQAMLNRQWMLSNLTDAETHDRVRKLDVMKLKILGEHPPQESAIQGPVRAFLFDDGGEGMRALTPSERNTIDQIITTIQNMVTRSRDGFERKQINTNIARTESESNSTGEDGSRIKGLWN